MWILLLVIVEFGGLFLLLYFTNKIQKRRSQIYSIIVEADSENIPLQNITSALQMDYSAVSKDISAMSNNGNYPLLRYSHIDITKQCLVLSKERLEKHRRKISKINKKQQGVTEQAVLECKTCGAINKNSSATECEYCGSPLK